MCLTNRLPKKSKNCLRLFDRWRTIMDFSERLPYISLFHDHLHAIGGCVVNFHFAICFFNVYR